ncbi:FAD/NAD(P)-binding domain-containing protein [Coniochaeta sp. PMI_546]|nr:FAD/NAD(P)-binding domain-containing protein [Coniochaeta sp. PMI_546]
MQSLDLVVIGAGWFGLAAAKTFHQLHPDKSLAILEASSTPGGVWAKHRLYPGLKSNNMLGTYEYPDFPLDSETFGVKPGEHIPGTVLHEYLTKYAEKFGILDKIKCNSKVLTAEHQEGPEGGWILTVQSTSEGASAETKILARKLILATGLTSEAFLPDFKGQETFNVPLFHSKDFKQHADILDSAKTVTVFGGTKSSFDAVYAFASKDIKVNWVIRETGHGPIWIAPPYVTPLKKWLEKLVHTRMLTWFSPCIWGDADGYVSTRRFYHGSAIGRAITNTFWSILGNDVLTLNKYDAHPETKKLKPWSEAMFTASSFSILTYPTDIFDLVRNGTVKVHIADITHLSPKTVHLSDGTALETGAMICATGWKHLPPLKFLPEGIDKDLGIPHTPAGEEPLFTPDTIERADNEILTRFPRLKQQPVQNKKLKPLLESDGVTTKEKINPSTPLTPYTLYRFMVPPSAGLLAKRDIAFAGVLMNFSVPLMAHAQALWINAYFDGKLPASVIPPSLDSADPPTAVAEGSAGKTIEEVRYETVLYSRFGKWRYPAGYGTRFPDFVFDALPYVDLLVRDLGLPIYRKKGWIAEATEPYGPEDYRGLVEEWKEKNGV